MKVEVSSHGIKVFKSKNGKSITVTSDKFADAAKAINDSRAQERIALVACAGDALSDYQPSEIPEIRGAYAKLATSNVVLAIRLWREGMAECNAYIRDTQFDQGVKVTVKMPKILNGEWTLDENGNITGGQASGGAVRI
jgi:hypothetical protein